MPERLDAHIHLFRHGYLNGRPHPTELDQYAELAKRHSISAALVVGYEGEPWAAGNNVYLARMTRRHSWIRATAYVSRANELTTHKLERLGERGFVGISLYLFGPDALTGLDATADSVWEWISRHKWLVSVNGRGAVWAHWRPIMERHPALRLVISHMGLPPAQSKPPAARMAEKALAPVTDLASFKGVHVKISGFYGLTEPRHDYPHRAAWPYFQTLHKAFGPRRLLWGSDFTPALNAVSFPQTLDVLNHLSGLTSAARRQIEGSNLRRLLKECR
jgi:predicted TIM-barrel fold metal-dependent hydrolase